MILFLKKNVTDGPYWSKIYLEKKAFIGISQKMPYQKVITVV